MLLKYNTILITSLIADRLRFVVEGVMTRWRLDAICLKKARTHSCPFSSLSTHGVKGGHWTPAELKDKA